jgi:hypothetical protein
MYADTPQLIALPTSFIDKYIQISSKKMTKEEEEQVCEDIRKNDSIFRLDTNHKWMHYIFTKSVNTKINSEIYKILKDFYLTPAKHKFSVEHIIEHHKLSVSFVKTMMKCSKITPDANTVHALSKNNQVKDEKLFFSIMDTFMKYGLKIDQTIKNIVDQYIYILCFTKLIDRQVLQDILSKPYSSNLIKEPSVINRILTSYIYGERSAIFFFENLELVPDLSNIKSIISNPYIANNNVPQKIIDFILFNGYVADRELVLLLLDYKVSVRSLEKYQIIMDDDIYIKCAKKNFYPYGITCVPTDAILHAELGKSDNLDTIKYLKELGGVFGVCCLEVASSIKRNSKVVKYLVEELGILSNETCIRNCLCTMDVDNWCQMTILLNKYTNKKITTEKIKPEIKLNEKSILVIEPKKINVDKDKDLVLKNKIKKFYQYKKKTIKYDELYKIFLEYLIKNKLIIGNYFVIDDNLAELFKINNCSILHIDQIDNIITYFIND